MNPIVLSYQDDNPAVVSLLLTALHLNKDSDKEDEVLFLDLGEKQERSLFFKRSDLVSIETRPAPSAEIFATVKQNIADIEAQIARQSMDDNWKQWIWAHLAEGFSKDVVYQALINHGFQSDVISRELNHEFCAANADPALVARLTGASQSKIYLPNATRFNTTQAEIYSIPDFLSEEECASLLELMKQDLEPSRVFAEEQINEARTSRTCFFKDRDNSQLYIRFIEDRVARTMGIHPSYMEGAQGQYYEVGQEYQPHADFFSKGTKEYEENCREGAPGQRTWTFLVYLTDEFEGGHTGFTQLGIDIEPKRGMALIWNNLYSNGEPNPYTHHQATKVEKGTKAILNFWFRERGQNEEMWVKPPAEYIRNYTQHGIAISEIPDHIYQKLDAYYQENKDNQARITAEEPTAHLNKGDDTSPASEVIALTDELRSFLHQELQPVCERWSGQTLEPTAIYGIRRYFEGARLDLHYDWSNTHVISAILCLDLNEDQQWPLHIDDNYYRRHQIMMKPKDMLLYEGARLLHGRPQPLENGFHCNLYVHYRPVNHVVPPELESQGAAAQA